jgi:hypothetical protein
MKFLLPIQKKKILVFESGKQGKNEKQALVSCQLIEKVGQKQSSMKTFPPRTSLDSNSIGLWPASAKYLAVDKPAKPAPAITTVSGLVGRAEARNEEDKYAASKKLTVLSSSGLGKSIHTTCKGETLFLGLNLIVFVYGILKLRPMDSQPPNANALVFSEPLRNPHLKLWFPIKVLCQLMFATETNPPIVISPKISKLVFQHKIQ